MKIADRTNPSHNVVLSSKSQHKRTQAQVGVGWGRIGKKGTPYIRIILNPGVVLDGRTLEDFHLTVFERDESRQETRNPTSKESTSKEFGNYKYLNDAGEDDIPF